MTRARRAWALVVALLIAAATIVYRFNLLGGQLGGFENDDFLVITRAAAMLHGEWPSRDFVDPGYPLTYVLSAVALHATGGTLLGHAALTVGMLALGAALTYWATVRATGSVLAGFIVALVQICLGPRLYNYPKVIVYAAAALAWWWYASHPTTGRLVWLAALTAAAFLLRHDHGAYLALGTGIVLLMLALADGVAPTVQRGVVYGAVVLVFLGPYFWYLQRSEGIVNHFRVGAEFSRVDRDRTALRRPVFHVAWAEPLWRVAPPDPLPAPHAKIQWRHPVPAAAARRDFAREHGLILRERIASDGEDYEVTNESPANLRAIAFDPRVQDTDNIDRQAWRIKERPVTTWWQRARRRHAWLRVTIAPGILRRENAVAFVYYVWLIIPPLALVAMAVMIRRDTAGAWPGVAPVAALAVLGFVLNIWFLRGTLPARLADVSVVTGVLGAWLIHVFAAARVRRHIVLRLVASSAIWVIVGLTVISAATVGDVPANLRTISDGAGASGLLTRSDRVLAELEEPSPEIARAAAGVSPEMRAADYLHACLPANERAFVTGYRPEVFYFANRRFGGGQVDVRAGYLSNPVDENLTIARLRAQAVPIVITDATDVFEARYRPESPVLAAYLDEAYVPVGDRDFAGERLRVLVRRGSRPAGTYAVLHLPCFQ